MDGNGNEPKSGFCHIGVYHKLEHIGLLKHEIIKSGRGVGVEGVIQVLFYSIYLFFCHC